MTLQGTPEVLQPNPALPHFTSQSLVPWSPFSHHNRMCLMRHYSVPPSWTSPFHLESWFGYFPTKIQMCKSYVAFWLIFPVASSESQMIPASRLVLRSCRLWDQPTGFAELSGGATSPTLQSRREAPGCWLSEWRPVWSICLSLLWTITCMRITAISTYALLVFAPTRYRALIYFWGHVQTTLTQTSTRSEEQLHFVPCSPFIMTSLFAVFLSPLQGLTLPESCQVSSCSCISWFPDMFSFPDLSHLILFLFVVLMLSLNTFFLLNVVSGSKPHLNGCPTIKVSCSN